MLEKYYYYSLVTRRRKNLCETFFEDFPYSPICPFSYVHWLKLEKTIPFLIEDGPIIGFGRFSIEGDKKGVKVYRKEQCVKTDD